MDGGKEITDHRKREKGEGNYEGKKERKRPKEGKGKSERDLRVKRENRGERLKGGERAERKRTREREKERKRETTSEKKGRQRSGARHPDSWWRPGSQRQATRSGSSLRMTWALSQPMDIAGGVPSVRPPVPGAIVPCKRAHIIA